MQEASNRGLRYIPGAHDRAKAELTVNGPIYDSRKGIGGYYRYCPRRIKKLIDDPYHDVKIARAKIHASVFNRIASGNDHYAPIVLPDAYAVVNASGTIGGPTLETASQAAARSNAQDKRGTSSGNGVSFISSRYLRPVSCSFSPCSSKPGLTARASAITSARSPNLWRGSNRCCQLSPIVG